MVVFAAIGAAVIAGIGGVVWLVANRVKSHHIDRTIQLPDSCKDLTAVKVLKHHQRDSVASALVNSPEFSWLATGKVNSDDPGEDQRKIAKYMVDCIFTVIHHYGHMIVSSGVLRNKFEGSIFFIPPHRYPWLFKFQIYKSPLVRIPVPYQLGDEVSARFDSFITNTLEYHRTLTEESAHWFILNVFVESDERGQGIGRKMVQAVIDMAKATDRPLPIFVECNDSHVAFFEKLGFKRKSRYFLTRRGAQEDYKGDESEEALPYNAMVYDTTIG